MQYKKGIPRDQLVMFQECLDDMIDNGNIVRFIDEYINTLDLIELGFKIPEMRTGRPPYDPALMLKIYIYCYFEKIRSSRKIEKEIRRNNELIWLSCGLQPDFKTIANFRKDNRKGIKNIFKKFLYFCKELNLLSLEVAAIDGTKLRAQNSLNEVYKRDTIDEVDSRIDKKINEYLEVLEENDKKENEDLKINENEITKVLNRLNKLKNRSEKVKMIKAMFDNDESLQRYFATDSTARFQSDKGKVRPGYNPQIVAEGKSKLIVANDVTNQSNDLQQMTPMIQKLKETKEELGITEKTKVVMDSGYESRKEILNNKDDKTVDILVCDKKEAQKKNEKIKPSSKNKTSKKIELSDFKYDKERDIYICPEGKELIKCEKRKKTNSDYFYYKCKDCADCPCIDKCTKDKTGRRIQVSVHIHEVDDYKKSMKTEENKKILSQRKELVEHPFGTIKRSFGFTYFMQKGIDKVKAEFSFICFIYNLKRILNIFGVKQLIMALKKG